MAALFDRRAEGAKCETLWYLLKAAFNDHPRASLMIQAFSEGLPLDNSVVDTVRFMGMSRVALSS